MSDDLVRLSKRLSWLLRHGAGEAQLDMDEAGWTGIEQVLRVLGVTRSQLDRAVQLNDKGRLVIEGSRVRACQGHSLQGMPVTVEGLEASWELVHPSTALWHGTKISAADGIASAGILPGTRTHVHLAPDPGSRVGKRGSNDLLLEISPASLASEDLQVFRAPNGVLLTRHVPVSAITGVLAVSKAGESGAEHARRAFKLVDRT